jgi:hypothetical protein
MDPGKITIVPFGNIRDTSLSSQIDAREATVHDTCHGIAFAQPTRVSGTFAARKGTVCPTVPSCKQLPPCQARLSRTWSRLSCLDKAAVHRPSLQFDRWRIRWPSIPANRFALTESAIPSPRLLCQSEANGFCSRTQKKFAAMACCPQTTTAAASLPRRYRRETCCRNQPRLSIGTNARSSGPI